MRVFGPPFTDKKEIKFKDLTKLGVNPRDTIHTKAIWFEAWKYQHEPNIVIALLHEIRNQLSQIDQIESQLPKWTKAFVASLVESLDSIFFEYSDSFLNANKTRITLKNPYTKWKEIRGEQQERDYRTSLASMEIADKLQKAIDVLLKLNRGILSDIWDETQKKEPIHYDKLVIIIDDLDRCQPEKAFQILETIKVYLNLNNCIFVLGMDQEAIEHIISQHYEKLLNPKATNQRELKKMSRLYLEKICQEIYHIPQLNSKQKYEYFDSLLTDAHFSSGSLLEEIRKIINLDGDGFAQGIDFLPPIARSIKVFVNTLILFINRVEYNLEIEDTRFIELTKQITTEETELNKLKGKRGKRRTIKEKETKLNSLKSEQTTRLIELRIGQDINSGKTKLLIILVYLYAFHYELYQMIYLYPKFFKGALIPFCEKGLTNGHPVLAEIVLPLSKISLTFEEAEQRAADEMYQLYQEGAESSDFGEPVPQATIGQKETKESRNSVPKVVEPTAFPFYHLRQVLWIRDLVVDPEVRDAATTKTLEDLNLL